MLLLLLLSCALLSWFTMMNDRNTIAAPTQYSGLAYCPCRIIWPTRESGMVRLRPTVTTSGVVRSMAYAQQMSETRDVTELTWKK